MKCLFVCMTADENVSDNDLLLIVIILATLLFIVILVLLIALTVYRHRAVRKYRLKPHRHYGTYYPRRQ